jgi:hypothetical protein
MKAYEITYSQDCSTEHEFIISDSVAAALEEFNNKACAFYVDILGIIENDLPPILRIQAF